MKKLGKSSKKGFTLVELIVVLVILAVLAAMLVPALVGYIDRAKKEKEYQAASTAYAAAQALATEAYGMGDTVASKVTAAEINKLTGLTVNAIQYTTKATSGTTADAYTIQTFAVQFDASGDWYTYTAGANSWSTSTSASS